MLAQDVRDRCVRRPVDDTFRAKLRYKRAHDRRPILATYADKLAMRAYVESVLGPGWTAPLYLATDDPAGLTADSLPREFVVKPTHGSGAGVLVASIADPAADLPTLPWKRALVHPDTLDWDRLRRLAGEWLERRYGPSEWCYRRIPPRLVCEELLLDGGRVPFDFRVYVFNGRARAVQIDQNRFGAVCEALYSLDWERLDGRLGWPKGPDVPRPERLAELTSAAEELARETDFLRVDFFAFGGRLVVGELTNYPWGGGLAFEPPETDRLVGSWWALPRRYTAAEVALVAERYPPRPADASGRARSALSASQPIAATAGTKAAAEMNVHPW